MLNVFDKNSKDLKLIEKDDISELTAIAGTGLTFYYNESIAVICINNSFASLTGGSNTKNEGCLVLPEKVVPSCDFYFMSNLILSSWVPNNTSCYLGFAKDSNSITLRVNSDITNVRIADTIVLPVSFFLIT